MPRVIHFEINAEKPERAVEFYSTVFGWKIDKWEGPHEYWMVKTGETGEPGINGAIMKRMNPLASTYNTIEVPSIDEFEAKISEHGGKVVIAKTEIPGIGHMAYCQDTEGNIFGIIENERK
jgi:uncharacterized protein